MSFTCSLTSCSCKEMLPFQCNNCKNFYCRKHHAYDKHECISIQTKTSRYVSEQEINIKNKCYFEDCSCVDELRLCKECNQIFCKKHISPWHVCIGKDSSTDKGLKKKFKKLLCCIC